MFAVILYADDLYSIYVLTISLLSHFELLNSNGRFAVGYKRLVGGRSRPYTSLQSSLR